MACCSLGYADKECPYNNKDSPYNNEDCPLGACTIPYLDEDVNTGVSDSQERGDKVVIKAEDYLHK